ncbi:hypothetical protein HELRODRAFT_193466 [Helobdella robusta]|uniref:BTB domain-containing protein n=1 Tax=Helobdella robusta TaxID=6412 RepID=T1FV09_HELRO|nr:hypothetical protein HELRODRAFT_193466 [Helobdella robusta]ESN96001.1 hypothetical protein HELRODRAFT_193466 [Helobdella robusta]
MDLNQSLFAKCPADCRSSSTKMANQENFDPSFGYHQTMNKLCSDNNMPTNYIPNGDFIPQNVEPIFIEQQQQQQLRMSSNRYINANGTYQYNTNAPLKEANQNMWKNFAMYTDKNEFKNHGDMVAKHLVPTAAQRSSSSNRVLEKAHARFDALFLGLANKTPVLDVHLAKKIQKSNANDEYALKQVSSISSNSQLSITRPTKRNIPPTRMMAFNSKNKVSSRDTVSERRSNKKLSMSAFVPGVRYQRPPSVESGVCYRVSYQDQQHKHKKRVKSLKDKTPRSLTLEMFEVDEKVKVDSPIKQPEEEMSILGLKTHSQSQFNTNNCMSDEEKMKSPKNKKQSNIKPYSILSSSGQEKTDEIKFHSFYNSTYSEGSDDSDECVTNENYKKMSQFNNNSIPKGTSFVSLAKEMLKKNGQSSTVSTVKHQKPFLNMYPYLKETELSRVLVSVSNEDLDDEMYDGPKNLERMKSTIKESDKMAKMKMSRSSLNTIRTFSSKRPNNIDKVQIYSMPAEPSLRSGNKKSRMYVTSNLPMKRLYEPIGVVNYLIEKYKDRQPKLSESGLGYDQTVKNVVKILHDSWLEQTQCDVAIVTKDGEIMAHQAVLSSFSSSLAYQFKANKPQCDTNDGSQENFQQIAVIDLSKFPRDVIADTLHFLYTTDIQLDSNNVTYFILVAKRLDLLVLLKMCEEYLLTSSNLDNIMLHFLIANNCEMTKIIEEMQQRIAKNFDIIWNKKHVVKLSKNLLVNLLTHKDLNMTEENKLQVVAKWIDYNRPERLKYIPDLMKLVNFEKFELESLMSRVQHLDWMFTDQVMRIKLLSAYNQRSHTPALLKTQSPISLPVPPISSHQLSQVPKSSPTPIAKCFTPIRQKENFQQISSPHLKQLKRLSPSLASPKILTKEITQKMPADDLDENVSSTRSKSLVALRYQQSLHAQQQQQYQQQQKLDNSSYNYLQLSQQTMTNPSNTQFSCATQTIETNEAARYKNDAFNNCRHNKHSNYEPANEPQKSFIDNFSPNQQQQHRAQQAADSKFLQQFSEVQQKKQQAQHQPTHQPTHYPLQTFNYQHQQHQQQLNHGDYFKSPRNYGKSQQQQPQQQAFTKRMESKCYQTDPQPPVKSHKTFNNGVTQSSNFSSNATTQKNQPTHYISIGTSMTPNISQNANDMMASNTSQLASKQTFGKTEREVDSTTSSNEDKNNWNKSQGLVSVYSPNYRPPPNKQYQLTSNSTSVRYVEL